MFDTLSSAQKWIESIHRFGDKYDLKRMNKACEMLNHPEKSFKSIHIGGTNGKGSTLTYLKNIYLEAGYSVGTYISPYIMRFNERITLNHQEISNEDLLKYINDIYAFSQRYLALENDQISFFELITLISFQYFRDKQPDIVLVEVGLGGTLDATNVIHPLASVITNIGFDHMHVLGNTLESIALNKLGIVKKESPLFTAVNQEELFPLFQNTTQSNKSTFYHLNDYPIEEIKLGLPSYFSFLGNQYKLNMHGLHQVTNAALALLTAQTLDQLNIIKISQNALNLGIEKAFWPGRFEIFGNIVLDGAHNLEGMQTCISTVKAYFPNHYLTVLFTVMEDKNYLPMIALLDSADRVVFTQISVPRCEKAQNLYNLSTHKNKEVYTDFKKAFLELKPQHDLELLLVTGSLYFVSEIRPLIIKEN